MGLTKEKTKGITTVIKHIGLFCGLLLMLWLLLVFSAMIPNEELQDNFVKSAESYNDVAPFHFCDGDKWYGIADNYADSILLNVAWHMGNGNPFHASIDTDYYIGDEEGNREGLYLSVTEGAEPNTDYTRYWHGSVMFLRPLHLFTDVDGIKKIGVGVLLVLIALTAVMLIRAKHTDLAVLLVLSMLAVHVWNLQLSLEYQPAFLVTFLLCPLYLWQERKGDIRLTMLSVAGGTMVAFFDFLTTETMTLLIPLILVVAVRAKEGRLAPMRESVVLLVKCGLCWGLSYAGAFLVKWIVASLVTGENEFLTAVTSAAERLGGEVVLKADPPNSIFSSIAANLTVLFGGTERVEVGRVLIGVLLYIGILLSVWYLFRTKETENAALLLLLLGAVVFLRYLVVNNHSYLHEFFTYRALAAPILATLVALRLNIRLPGKRKP